MERLGILTGADLASWSLIAAGSPFRQLGPLVLADRRGIDEREVKPDRPYKSVSAERTFDEDFPSPTLRRGAGAGRRLCLGADRAGRGRGRTVTLKVKFADFTLITRSKSFADPVARVAAFEAAGQALLGRLLPGAQGHPAARPRAPFDLVEGRIASPFSWDWQFEKNM